MNRVRHNQSDTPDTARMRSGVVRTLVIAVLVIAGLAAFYVVPRQASSIVSSAVEVPQPNLEGVDQELVATFNQVRDAVVREPENDERWGAFAMLCDAHGLYDVAKRCYQRARALDKVDFRWAYHEGCLLSTQGENPGAAIKAYEEAVRLRNDFAPAHVRLAIQETLRGNYVNARLAYRKALSIEPESAAALRGLGQLELATDNPEAAVTYLERAVGRNAVDRGTLSSLAQAYLRLGRESDADTVATRAQSAPSHFEMEDPERARVERLSVNPASVYARAKQLLDNGDFAQAVSKFTDVRRMLPRDPYAPLFQAVAYLKLGSFTESRQAFEAAASLKSELESADQAYRLFMEALWDYRTQYLGTAWYKATPDVVQEALSDFSQAAATEPEYVGPRGFLTWGTTLCRMGRLEEGLAKFRESVRLDPQYEKGLYNIGATLEELGRPQEAVDYYRKAASLNPRGNSAIRLSQLTNG